MNETAPSTLRPSTPPRHVLVTYASRHGSTEDIAQAIATELRNTFDPKTADVACLPVTEVTDIEPFDAVVLGSAVYLGRWLSDARKFLSRNEASLIEREVWLFSSGPVEKTVQPPKAAGDHVLATRVGAREHRMFPGRLRLTDLNLVERAVTRLVKGTEGDYRDFDEIARWARHIASQVVEPVVSDST